MPTADVKKRLTDIANTGDTKNNSTTFLAYSNNNWPFY